MKKKDLYKKLVLGLLFVFPLLVYLFFASGKNNFAKLPSLSEGVAELSMSKLDNSPMLQVEIDLLLVL